MNRSEFFRAAIGAPLAAAVAPLIAMKVEPSASDYVTSHAHIIYAAGLTIAQEGHEEQSDYLDRWAREILERLDPGTMNKALTA